ncbi:FAD-binding oxidoreductase [Leifsonia sp. SIMBA_070]|uniref:FAD-binding oxidoreductase n=1 Tax=Leifsonia sp. SIMBA_070 TaxID=3085810 RepID=UPI00397A0BF3
MGSLGDARPRSVVRCRSEQDVVRSIRYASAAGLRVTPRGGGHCFAGRSSSGDIVLDLSGLDGVAFVDDETVEVGAGVLLGGLYAALHDRDRTLPAGCGSTVGVAGLALGGGIGLLGRAHGLTCDRLLAARVVLADGRTVECDEQHEPDLFWALRGAGGGQFGVVTLLRLSTVPEPVVRAIESGPVAGDLARVLSAWQRSAGDAPDELTMNLTVERTSSGRPTATFTGVSTLPAAETESLLREFAASAGIAPPQVSGAVPFSTLKEALADRGRATVGQGIRIRSEFFSRPMTDRTTAALMGELASDGAPVERRLTFTAMGGAYDRVATGDTAFAHRTERYLLEHVGSPEDPWVDRSWATVHSEASGRVYPNFPDLALDDPLTAYHGDNLARLSAVKRQYDPSEFFHFPQSIPPEQTGSSTGSPQGDTKEVPA